MIVPAMANVIGVVALAGCGDGSSVGRLNLPPHKETNAPGYIVKSRLVMPALRKTGLRIIYRPGPTPAGTVWARYGTAENAHHAKINFGIFLTGNTTASSSPEESLTKFVPHATTEGMTSGESYLVVTSAGYGTGGHEDATREQFGMFDELTSTIGGLAPAAAKEEGP